MGSALLLPHLSFLWDPLLLQRFGIKDGERLQVSDVSPPLPVVLSQFKIHLSLRPAE